MEGAMGDSGTIYQTISDIFASTERTSIFNIICQNEPILQHEIAKNAGCENATVTKAVAEFLDYGLVERVDDTDEIQLTIAGEFFKKYYISFAQGLVTIENLKPFFEEVEKFPGRFGDTQFFDIAPHLSNAELFEETKWSGDQARRPYREMIRSSDTVREIVHRRTEVGANIAEWVDNGELSAEFVMSPDLLENMLDMSDHTIDQVVGSIFRYEGDCTFPGYTITITENSVGFLGYRDNFVFVRSDSNKIRNWAINTFEKYRDDSSKWDPEI